MNPNTNKTPDEILNQIKDFTVIIDDMQSFLSHVSTAFDGLLQNVYSKTFSEAFYDLKEKRSDMNNILYTGNFSFLELSDKNTLRSYILSGNDIAAISLSHNILSTEIKEIPEVPENYENFILQDIRENGKQALFYKISSNVPPDLKTFVSITASIIDIFSEEEKLKKRMQKIYGKDVGQSLFSGMKNQIVKKELSPDTGYIDTAEIEKMFTLTLEEIKEEKSKDNLLEIPSMQQGGLFGDKENSGKIKKKL